MGMREGGLAVAMAGVLALGLTACGGGGAAAIAESVGGLPVTHFESGLRANAPAPGLEVENAADDESDKIATATITDVEAYWSKQLPDDFGVAFQPVKS